MKLEVWFLETYSEDEFLRGKSRRFSDNEEKEKKSDYKIK